MELKEESGGGIRTTPSTCKGEGWGGGVKERAGVNRNATPVVKANAKTLRRNQTSAESLLWKQLRAKRFEDYKFRRQHAIGHYVVDFVCLKAKLVIELDGGQHAEQQEEDRKRTTYLESFGFRVLRFWNNEVMENLEGVLLCILDVLQRHPLPNPPVNAKHCSAMTGRGNLTEQTAIRSE